MMVCKLLFKSCLMVYHYYILIVLIILQYCTLIKTFNFMEKKANPFPLAPKSVSFVVEMTAGAEFESYMIRLTNGQPVYGASNFDALLETLKEYRDKFVLGKENE